MRLVAGGNRPSAPESTLSLAIFAALLFAAALHAGWNALVRRDSDRQAASVAVAAGGTAVGAAVVLFLPPIAPAAIPFVIASSLSHILYYALIARAYAHGDLSVVYPIMRGLAPLIVTVIGAAFFGETVSFGVFIGVGLVTAGIVTLGADGFRNGQAGIGPALLNAMVIATYTLIDGLGARASAAPESYTAWILIGGGLFTVGFALYRRGSSVLTGMASRLWLGLAGGVMGFGAYGIALWAMTIAPIGAVAAVRESSVLFATALGAIFLGERFGPFRWVAAALVVGGLALVKLGGVV